MGIKVLKKNDGFWLSFDSSKGKHALVHINKVFVVGGGIINKAILETCEECASGALVENSNSADSKPEAGAQPCGEHNKSSLTCLCDSCKVVNDSDCPKTKAFRNRKKRS